jgi:hypothetical protein
MGKAAENVIRDELGIEPGILAAVELNYVGRGFLGEAPAPEHLFHVD